MANAKHIPPELLGLFSGPFEYSAEVEEAQRSQDFIDKLQKHANWNKAVQNLVIQRRNPQLMRERMRQHATDYVPLANMYRFDKNSGQMQLTDRGTRLQSTIARLLPGFALETLPLGDTTDPSWNELQLLNNMLRTTVQKSWDQELLPLARYAYDADVAQQTRDLSTFPVRVFEGQQMLSKLSNTLHNLMVAAQAAEMRPHFDKRNLESTAKAKRAVWEDTFKPIQSALTTLMIAVVEQRQVWDQVVVSWATLENLSGGYHVVFDPLPLHSILQGDSNVDKKVTGVANQLQQYGKVVEVVVKLLTVQAQAPLPVVEPKQMVARNNEATTTPTNTLDWSALQAYLNNPRLASLEEPYVPLRARYPPSGQPPSNHIAQTSRTPLMTGAAGAASVITLLTLLTVLYSGNAHATVARTEFVRTLASVQCAHVHCGCKASGCAVLEFPGAVHTTTPCTCTQQYPAVGRYARIQQHRHLLAGTTCGSNWGCSCRRGRVGHGSLWESLWSEQSQPRGSFEGGTWRGEV